MNARMQAVVEWLRRFEPTPRQRRWAAWAGYPLFALFAASRPVTADDLVLLEPGLTDAMVRARVDMNSLALHWPLPLRHFARVMVSSASTAVFAVLMIISRVVMWHMTWPSRSYLLMVSAKLALAWLAVAFYYLRQRRSEFNPILHIVLPVISPR